MGGFPRKWYTCNLVIWTRAEWCISGREPSDSRDIIIVMDGWGTKHQLTIKLNVTVENLQVFKSKRESEDNDNVQDNDNF